jgi:multidrug resistance efflux pump
MLGENKSVSILSPKADEAAASRAPLLDASSKFTPAHSDGLDVSGIQAVLKNAVEQPLHVKTKPAAKPDAEPIQPIRLPKQPPKTESKRGIRRLIKAAVALSLVLIVGWEPLQTLLEPTSVQAVVNARVVTLKSPIAGEIITQNLPAPGDAVDIGDSLLRVINPRAERARLDDLRRSIAQLNDERSSLVEKRDWAKSQRASLLMQTKAFAAARVRELEAKRDELESELTVALAKNTEAQEALTRSSLLAINGSTSTAELQRNQRDAAVAKANVLVARSRIVSIIVELDALKAGTFVGDSYNDRPSTAQMADDMAVRISDIEAELRTRDARASSLRAELAEEEKYFESTSQFDMKVPVNGRVWEIMTAPGEQVAPGQKLVNLLDCSGAVVTASVSESVYNHLSVGMPARFRLRDSKRDYPGEVVNLTGVAGAGANFAIEPSSLMKEPYRVTVAVPGIATGATCDIGRTGRVFFNQRPTETGFSLRSLFR